MQGNTDNNQKESEPYSVRPGDRKFRVPRRNPLHIILPKIRPPRPALRVSLMSFVYGFAAMIAIGTILLLLPFSSNNGQFTSFINSLFTSTSAVCVTGLVVVDTLDHWNLFGQIVIAVLIQFGGLGFMMTTTIFMLLAGRKIGLRDRILLRESAVQPFAIKREYQKSAIRSIRSRDARLMFNISTSGKADGGTTD